MILDLEFELSSGADAGTAGGQGQLEERNHRHEQQLLSGSINRRRLRIQLALRMTRGRCLGGTRHPLAYRCWAALAYFVPTTPTTVR